MLRNTVFFTIWNLSIQPFLRKAQYICTKHMEQLLLLWIQLKRNDTIGFSIYVLVGENLRPIQSVISFFPVLGRLRVLTGKWMRLPSAGWC